MIDYDDSLWWWTIMMMIIIIYNYDGEYDDNIPLTWALGP